MFLSSTCQCFFNRQKRLLSGLKCDKELNRDKMKVVLFTFNPTGALDAPGQALETIWQLYVRASKQVLLHCASQICLIVLCSTLGSLIWKKNH